MPGLLFLLIAAGFATLTGPASADPADKVYVCKYVGTPGVDEVLQTGNNPIEVSVSAIPTYDPENPLQDEAAELVGDEFIDGQGRSIVIAVSAGPGRRTERRAHHRGLPATGRRTGHLSGGL